MFTRLGILSRQVVSRKLPRKYSLKQISTMSTQKAIVYTKNGGLDVSPSNLMNSETKKKKIKKNK